MRLRVSSIVLAVPLALCLATAIVWARSWSHPISVAFIHERQQCRAWLNAGRVGVDNDPQVAIETAQYERDLNVTRGLSRFVAGRDLMAVAPNRITPKWSRTSAWLLPAIAMLFAGFAVVPPAFRRAFQTARTIRRQCTKCGYNLTGNTSGVCPECGTSVVSIADRQHA